MSGEFSKAVENNYCDLKEKFLFTARQLAIIIDSVNSAAVVPGDRSQLTDPEDIMRKYINKVTTWSYSRTILRKSCT